MRNRSHMEECRCAECSAPRERVFMPPEPVRQVSSEAANMAPSTASVAAAVRHVEGGGTHRLVLLLDEGPPGLHLYTAIRVRQLTTEQPTGWKGLTATVVARAMSLAACQTAILALPSEGRQAGDSIVILQLQRAYKVGEFGDLAMEWSAGDVGGVTVLRNHLA